MRLPLLILSTFTAGWIPGLGRSLTDSLATNTDITALDHLPKYGTGAYVNEAAVGEVKRQTAFFGDNTSACSASRTSTINVLINWKGIGYAGQEAQAAFRCYQHA